MRQVNVKKTEIKAKEATITVTTTMLGGQKMEQKRIKIRPFVTETATMGVRLGSTINTGDFSSARIDVSVFMPCYVEEAAKALQQCYEVADKFLSKKIEDVRGDHE